MKHILKTIVEKVKGWLTAAKTLCASLWTKFTAWKYHLYALWGGAAVVVIAVGVVIALCLANPTPNDPSISGTDPTGTVATAPDGTPITNPTTSDGTPVTTPDGGNSGGNSGGSNNGGNSGNNKPGNTGNSDDENTNSDAPPAPEGTADQMKNVVAVKTASAGGTITAHPGGRIIYTISITNNNSAAIGVTVTDTLPEGTVLVSGCSNASGSSLTWKVNSIGAGETHNIKYAVKPNYTVQQVRDSKTDIILKNTGAKVMDNAIAAPGKDIYVLETFNTTDQKRMAMGIDALVTANLSAKNSSNEPFNRVSLVSQMYNVGFSNGTAFGSADPDQLLDWIFESATTNTSPASGSNEEKGNKLVHRVVPTLYGGTAVPASKDVLFRGSRATSVSADDLIVGDVILFTQNGAERIYIYDGTYLVELGETAVTTNIKPETALSILPSTQRYVVFRPSIDLKTPYSLQDDEYFNDYDKQEYTELENAIIKTAETYLLRGDRAQYTDDYSGINTARYESATRQPEDYTADQYGYTNCASFTYDVHWATYGYKTRATLESGSSMYLHATEFIASSAKYGWNPDTLKGGNASTIFYIEPPKKATGSNPVTALTETEQAALKQQICSLLRPGDVICIRRTTGYGHAMLYIGNGLIIHSTGSSYSSTNKTDTHEATIRYRQVEELFDEAYGVHTVYALDSFSVIRPQNLTTPKITENTKNRINYMQGVVAEKVASTAMGKTVNPGDEITYTFYIFNTNDEAKNFQIKDTLSEYVTFVSATDGGKCSGSEVSWSFSVPANTRVAVSYTVKVKDGVAAYTAIDGSKATINGVVHKCLDTYVANTLTAAQQQQIVAAVNKVKTMDVSGLNSVQIANRIYKEAFGVDNIFGDGVTTYTQLLHGDSSNSVRNDNVGIFNDSRYYSSKTAYCMTDLNTSKGAMMVAPGMYGGQNVITTYDYASEPYKRYTNVGNKTLRSVYFWEKDLVIGDLFLMSTESSQQSLYIYIGNDTFVSLGQGHTLFSQVSVSARFQYAPATSWKYLAVLRPSMVWENI